MQFLIRCSSHLSVNSCFRILKNSNSIIKKRWIGTKTYQQLSLKGLLCSHFPDNVDLNELLSKKQTIYAGFDATNKSLHIGNLLVLLTLFHLNKNGHRIIILIGDATARIGDPSGKLIERQIIDDNLIDLNALGLEQDIKNVWENYRKYFLKQNNDKKDEIIILRNSSWFKNLNVIDFINKYARHIRMGDMLSKKAIKERLKSPSGLNFAEFSYQTFQAYDWLHLFRKYNCKFQIGGIDQTINIHNGYDLIKKIEQKLSYGMFIPLITDDKGQKIGKSESTKKTIFLNPELTTPFGLYQYFMRLPDSQINRFLKLFSFRSLEEIEQLIQNQLKNPKPWYLQKKLAEEITLLIHGENGLKKAQRITEALFEKNLKQLGLLNDLEIQDVFDGVPIIHLEFQPNETNILQIAMKSKFFDSELEALKCIEEGGFYLNYSKQLNPSKILLENSEQSSEQQNPDILSNGITIISLGKRNHKLIKWL